MDTKELKIQIPEGYEIDKENSTFEKIVFKKKDTKTKKLGRVLLSATDKLQRGLLHQQRYQ